MFNWSVETVVVFPRGIWPVAFPALIFILGNICFGCIKQVWCYSVPSKPPSLKPVSPVGSLWCLSKLSQASGWMVFPLYDRPADTLEAQAQCAMPAVLSIHRRGFYFGRGWRGWRAGVAALHSEETTGASADVTETGVQISRFSESVLDGDSDGGLSFWSRIPWRRRRRKGKECHGAPSCVELDEMPPSITSPTAFSLCFTLARVGNYPLSFRSKGGLEQQVCVAMESVSDGGLQFEFCPF